MAHGEYVSHRSVLTEGRLERRDVMPLAETQLAEKLAGVSLSQLLAGRNQDMANQRQAATRRLKMSEGAQQQLELHYPGFPAQWLWRAKPTMVSRPCRAPCPS